MVQQILRNSATPQKQVKGKMFEYAYVIRNINNHSASVNKWSSYPQNVFLRRLQKQTAHIKN